MSRSCPPLCIGILEKCLGTIDGIPVQMHSPALSLTLLSSKIVHTRVNGDMDDIRHLNPAQYQQVCDSVLNLLGQQGAQPILLRSKERVWVENPPQYSAVEQQSKSFKKTITRDAYEAIGSMANVTHYCKTCVEMDSSSAVVFSFPTGTTKPIERSRIERIIHCPVVTCGPFVLSQGIMLTLLKPISNNHLVK
jgi:hypothetical protein